jgi:hypothetical protein
MTIMTVQTLVQMIQEAAASGKHWMFASTPLVIKSAQRKGPSELFQHLFSVVFSQYQPMNH